jgi:hypothetical protein
MRFKIVVLMAFAAVAYGNDAPLPPAVMHFCAAHCVTWYLTNDHKGYAATADSPSIPDNSPGVVIQSFTLDSVVLNRTDPPNQWFPKGLKAVITGQISPEGDTLINGKIHWTFGQSGIYDVRITWGAALDSIPGADAPPVAQVAPDAALAPQQPQAKIPDVRLPPAVLHFCAAHCFTWYLTNDHKGYAGVPGYPGIGEDGIGITIESFTRDSVVLDRSDPPNKWFPKGLKAVITGQINPAGNILQFGQMRWTFGQSGVSDVHMTWGTALDALPANDPPEWGQGGPPNKLAAWEWYMATNFPEFMAAHPLTTVPDENPREKAYRLEKAKDLAREQCYNSTGGRYSGANNKTSACHGYDDAQDALAEAYDEMHE